MGWPAAGSPLRTPHLRRRLLQGRGRGCMVLARRLMTENRARYAHPRNDGGPEFTGCSVAGALDRPTGLRQQHRTRSDDGIHRLRRLPGASWLAMVVVGTRNRVSRRVGGSWAVVRSEPASGFSRIGATSARRNGNRGGGRATAQEPEAWQPNLDTALLATGHVRCWGAIGRGRPRGGTAWKSLADATIKDRLRRGYPVARRSLDAGWRPAVRCRTWVVVRRSVGPGPCEASAPRPRENQWIATPRPRTRLLRSRSRSGRTCTPSSNSRARWPRS